MWFDLVYYITYCSVVVRPQLLDGRFSTQDTMDLDMTLSCDQSKSSAIQPSSEKEIWERVISIGRSKQDCV